MGNIPKEGAWIVNGRGIRGTGAEDTFCHTVVLGTTCLARGA